MKFKKWHIAGLGFIIVIGTLLHFLYDISGENQFVAYFAAVNESVWEHLKLIFWPVFFFMIPEYFFYGKNETDFFAIKMAAVFGSLAFIVISYYTYSGVLGFNLPAIDIAIFVVSALICQFVSYTLINRKPTGDSSVSFRGLVVILLFAMCFVLWTHNPPALGIFC